MSAQNATDREQIISQTNLEALNKLVDEFKTIQKKYALKKVNREYIDEHGQTHYFSHFEKDGKPVYYALENESSAISSKIDVIRVGGSSGLELDGSGIEFGLWDGGNPRDSHQEFEGRIFKGNQWTNSFHATHVAGILIAAGIEPEAKGMAPAATIDSYTSSDWQQEIPLWAAEGGMITNHSYIISNPQEDYEKYGIYSSVSQLWDSYSYNAPYLILVTGASNNGNNDYNPDNSRFDLLATNKLGKNSIVVGACSDVLNYTGPSSVNQAVFTSWGPTDDWRIKPDITAVGTSSFSTRDANDFNYGTGQGCSYAAPVVAGGLALLQQHYQNQQGVYMKSATAKALILCTTDEAGLNDGPDFSNGWGLFNAEKAAEVITNNGTSASIIETSLNQDAVYKATIEVNGTEPLTVALSWNDPAAEPLPNEIYNDPTPMLINDLDVRVISDSEMYFPWKMEPNENFDNYQAAAVKGDNSRDNIEVIQEENVPAGTYTIMITHKNTLVSGSQDFSLIVSGIAGEVSSSKETLQEDQLISVYPNPVNGILNVNTGDIKIGLINVFSFSGQKVKEVDFKDGNKVAVDVHNLEDGTYILQVKDANHVIIGTRKLVVE